MRACVRLFAAPLLFMAAARTHADGFFFRPNDRVMFLGDSITEQYQYSTNLELYLTTRFPTWNLTFLNAGIGGDTAQGGKGRLSRHVLDEKPTAMTIDFGMNDGGYGKFEEAKQKTYVESTEAMLNAAAASGIRVALASPNAVDVRGKSFFSGSFPLYLETQRQFYEPLAGLAKTNQVPFVDQYAATRALLEKLQAGKRDDVQPFPDGIHTGPAGGLLMAHIILKGLNAPALVSDLSVDVADRKWDAKRCKVEKLEVAANRVGFERLDEALPLPVQKDWQPIVPLLNDLKDLNWLGLTVIGLEAGKYAVAVDGQDVGSYMADELAAGVNLGNVTSGPIYEQSQKVFDAINRKNDIVHKRFRSVVMFNPPDWLAQIGNEERQKELDKRMGAIKAVEAEIRTLVQPKPRRFVIQKSG
jgi:lysophospholipase L1-like esterase